MITPEQVWLAVEPVDMRMGIDGLSLRIQQLLGCSPCDGTAYAFCNRQGNRVKLVVWDGTGVWLCVRRLHQGRFSWLKPGSTTCTLSATEWQWLTKGVDWRRLNAKAPAKWRV